MIIGITGTDGAGKGTVVEYLAAHGFVHYSARGLITQEIEKRGLAVNRDNTRLVANSLRAEFGPAVIAQKYIERAQKENIGNCIIESVRSLGEAEAIKAAGGILLAVDANQAVRYGRNVARGTSLDKISFEKFCEQETVEMNDPDPSGMQKAKVMEMADYTIMNDSTVEELEIKVENFLITIVAKKPD